MPPNEPLAPFVAPHLAIPSTQVCDILCLPLQPTKSLLDGNLPMLGLLR